MDKPLISINNLTHTLSNGTKVLDSINLDFYRNSFTVLTGRNGSGKTFLMKHLNGLLLPTEGEVLINNISTEKDSWNARIKVGFVFQNSNTQIIAQTVEDDIAFGLENIGLPSAEIEKRINESAEAMGITSLLEKSPHRISGGEKKRTAIAGIVAMQPDIIIFDEPFAGLDFEGVKLLLRKLIFLKESGTSIIVITHDLEKLLAHADRLVVMSKGKIVGDGNPDAMLKTAAENGIRIPPSENIETMTWLYESSKIK
ncbi:MAG: ABC transporter ATP-binding protein [Spirochaetales bacterium]|nr:ABC transporter ATP-binding protein [Spirochaetales bacterium]